MSFIHFTQKQLHDLNFSLNRETLLTNNKGVYSSSTLIHCNTRKYHGLLVAPQSQADDSRYVFLSSIDETIFRKGVKVNIGMRRHPNVYYPEGYIYLYDFSYEHVPTWTIRVDDILLRKEILLDAEDERVLIRYTVVEAKLPFRFQVDPFLAFRNIHTVGKSNIDVIRKVEKITNGIRMKIYSGLSALNIQFSKMPDFIPVPDWYYNTEYVRESERGYEFLEDIYHPGYFTLSLRKNDQLIFSAGLSEISPRKMKTTFDSNLKQTTPLTSLDNCLRNAAQQFIVGDEREASVIAGFHWFGKWGRDTFISLPGLTLVIGKYKLCKTIINTMLKDLKDGLFPNVGAGSNAVYNSADASLWFFWTLQQYAFYTGSISTIWKEYGDAMKSILENYRKGTLNNIHVLENGLLYAGKAGIALTWMDAVVDGNPVTPRTGLAVELNALWYNAICFSLEAAALEKDKKFTDEWSIYPERIETAFTETFWDSQKGYLADCVNINEYDWSIRPNQVFAASLPYSPLKDEMKMSMLEIVKEKLLTPRGLRTLSPDDEHYIGVYEGNHRQRDFSYHQGTVWPWLLGHFSEAYLRVYGKAKEAFVKSLYENFTSALVEYGIGTIPEIYDGNAPHRPKGAISQGWSVAELIRMKELFTSSVYKRMEPVTRDVVAQTINH